MGWLCYNYYTFDTETELLDLLLPALRADFSAFETYHYVAGQQLSCPITALCSHDDGIVSREGLLGWREQTTGGFEIESLPGGHFFVHSALDEVLTTISRPLRRGLDCQ